jgi:hypothetical protein
MDPRPNADTQPSAKQLQGKAIARARLEAMQARARRIRRYVTGTACGLFIAAFLGVYVQLASGHDPALVAATKRSGSVSLTATASTGSATKSAAAKAAAAEERTAERKRAAAKKATEEAAAAKASSTEESSSGSEGQSSASESSSGSEAEASSSSGETSSESPSSVTTSQS